MPSERIPRRPAAERWSPHATLAGSLDRADAYLEHLVEDGHWVAPADANVTLTAELLMLRRSQGLVDEIEERRMTGHLLDQQTREGAWTLYHGGPGNLSATIEAYFALKLTGRMRGDEPEMARARDFIRSHGGISRARVFTKIALAGFGQFDWSGLPTIPLQIVLLPRWVPYNPYELASWARSCMIPLAVVLADRPTVAITPEHGVEELFVEPAGPERYQLPRDFAPFSQGAFFYAADRVLKRIEGNLLRLGRDRARREIERWILAHQDSDGGWAGIYPAIDYSVRALRCLGYPLEHPAVRAGLRSLEAYQVEEGRTRWQQSTVSPTWDTAWVAAALLETSEDPRRPAVHAAIDWLLPRQGRIEGDWAVRAGGVAPGGWAFEYDNDHFPDTDDTIAVLTLLHATDRRVGADAPAFERGLAWLEHMQGRDGGFAAFDRDLTRESLNEIPFADLKAMLDPSCADITGRALELLGRLGRDESDPTVALALEFLKGAQRPDGSWLGRWGVAFLYGTWGALVGAASIGARRDEPWVARALDWIASVQNPDGSFGESCGSYDEDSYVALGEGVPSQTAWALLARLAFTGPEDEVVRRAASWLITVQLEAGDWHEPHFTGTGFPRHFYLRYRLYKDVFPTLALATYRNALRRAAARADQPTPSGWTGETP